MSAHAIVWWATLIALVAVLALTGAQVARAWRELKRLKERVAGYAELPVMTALENAETGMHRLERAADNVAPLIDRAHAALAVIRRGPVPPELIAAVQRIRAEIVALRTFASR